MQLLCIKYQKGKNYCLSKIKPGYWDLDSIVLHKMGVNQGINIATEGEERLERHYYNIRNLTYPSYPGHTGIDVNIGVTGKSVVAVKGGTVVTSTALKNSDGSYRSYGEYIIINHGDGTMTLYAHMLAGSRKVQQWDTVKQGQVIGTVGSTGNSTGTHLHFGLSVKIKSKKAKHFL